MRNQQSWVVWLLAWIVIIAVLYALTRAEWGKSIVAAVLWLSIILILVTRYKEIADLFNKANITEGQV